MNTVESAKLLLLQSGASWVLWLLAGLSIVTVVISVERWLYLRSRGGQRLEVLARQVAEPLAAGDWDAARDMLLKDGTAAACIAAAGVELAKWGAPAAEKAMDSAVSLERTRMERRLAFLGTVGNNAPFVGLFGTVVGVIHAFEELGHAAPGHGVSAGGPVASHAVMVGIAEALVATAVGIFVALPAVAAYNYLQRRVAGILSASKVLSDLVLAYLIGAESLSSQARKDVSHGAK